MDVARPGKPCCPLYTEGNLLHHNLEWGFSPAAWALGAQKKGVRTHGPLFSEKRIKKGREPRRPPAKGMANSPRENARRQHPYALSSQPT